MEVVINKGLTGDRNYKANFEINRYTLTFKTNGGNSINAEE